MYRKLGIAMAILLLLLFGRDTPYLNTQIVDKVWMFYLLLLFILLVPFRMVALYMSSIFLIVFATVVTFYNLSALAEIAGVAIYFLLVSMVILKLWTSTQVVE
ncbi:MAG: hypothetical protein Q8Q65_03205 [bacterium]|nr:hypothetical protein [bacterium]